MAGLHVYTSNRMEILAEQLAQLVRRPLPAPLSPEVIVVQSRGMERWISMELARINGVSANCLFPFPNAILEDIFKLMMPDLPDTSPFEPDLMTFRLMKIISQSTVLREFDDLNAYLADDRHDLKLYQLAGKLADLFDQYQVFRPRLLFKWEQFKEERRQPDLWQARLWRELVRGHEGLHRARLRENLLSRIKDGQINPAVLPLRIALFGISHLPLFHLEAFAALSRLIEINLFIISPCREYWGDIISDREMKKIRRKTPRVAENIEWYHFDKGNRLLASMGTQGRDFFTLISDLDGEIIEQFEDPPEDTVLSCLQSDILNLRDRERDCGTLPISDRETTIQVHSCHSPMREIEVLHDNLLAMFEADPQLLPKDIIVMAPDIETYAPYVQAVFDSQTDRASRIPYSIADQSPRTQSRLVEGFLTLLDISESRFEASQVLSLLEFPGIKERFDLMESDQNILEHWVSETRIRWGIDAEFRKTAGYSESSANTWKAGMERLLLGYAMPGENLHMVNGVLPYDNIEGSDGQILGNFLNFASHLFSWSRELSRPKHLGQWQKTLTALIDRFFRPDEKQERELYFVRSLLDNLTHIETNTALHDTVSLTVIKSYLKSNLEQSSYGAGFLTGGVTFCAMLPMRSIPFNIICLIGMDNDAYPREFQPLNFDLIARYPRAGDRSRRNDDKYLFLESIISARKRLYISYVGQSIQDNSAIPPSVLVSELLETVETSFVRSDKTPLENIVTRHRLQPFSRQYFLGGTGLFSYSMENMLACTNQHEVPPAFVSNPIPLSDEEEEWKNLDMDSLCRFFANPARYFTRKRLGMVLEDESPAIEDRENFILAALEKYQVEQKLLEARMSGLKFEDYKPVLTAQGQLPHGKVGEFSFNKMSSEIELFVSKILPYTDTASSQPLDVDLNIGDYNLSGRLSEFAEPGLVCVRYARQKTRDILTAWIHHLVLGCQGRPEYPQTSFLICKDSAMTFGPVPQSQALLEHLLGLYRSGLEAPIHFFPETSYTYAWQKLEKSASDRTALKKAAKIWQGDEGPRKFYRPESDDPYYTLCYRRLDVLDEEFKEIAMAVFTPIFEYSRNIML